MDSSGEPQKVDNSSAPVDQWLTTMRNDRTSRTTPVCHCGAGSNSTLSVFFRTPLSWWLTGKLHVSRIDRLRWVCCIRP